jgi:hypothetical protein
MHDFRVVWGTTHANLVFDVCVPFGFVLSDAELVRQVTERVCALGEHYYCVITVDHDYVPVTQETKN